jgi:hypothetical protein
MCLLSPLNSFVNILVSGERPSTYHDIYKAIHEREPTLTTLFTKLFKGDSKHIYNIYKTI